MTNAAALHRGQLCKLAVGYKRESSDFIDGAFATGGHRNYAGNCDRCYKSTDIGRCDAGSPDLRYPARS